MTRPDVLGVGEVLALLEPRETGALEDVASFVLRVAGAEVNLLVGVARQGHRAALLSAVGDDPFGRYVRRTLRAEGVDLSQLHTDADRRTGVFFKELTPEDRRRVFYYRDGSAASALAPEVLERAMARRPRLVAVSGLTLGLGDRDAGLAATARAALAAARRAGAGTVFDANLRPGLFTGDVAAEVFEDVVGDVDLLLAGRDELQVLLPGSDDPIVAAERALRLGCRGVIVKDGGRGSTVVEADGVHHVPALPVPEVVDPVGAGDAFGAGVVAGQLRGWSLLDAARLGSVLGAQVVASRGDWEGIPDAVTSQRLLGDLPQGVAGERVP